MNELLENGLGLMVLGMGFVFLFLVVLIFATGYMSRLLNHYFPEVLPVATKAAAPLVKAEEIDPQLITAITAAVHQHRNSNNV